MPPPLLIIVLNHCFESGFSDLTQEQKIVQRSWAIQDVFKCSIYDFSIHSSHPFSGFKSQYFNITLISHSNFTSMLFYCCKKKAFPNVPRACAVDSPSFENVVMWKISFRPHNRCYVSTIEISTAFRVTTVLFLVCVRVTSSQVLSFF